MAPRPNNSPLIVIVGETASGKTALAVELAGLVGGEIIAADSRTVYRGMDIGTAKPTTKEQKIIQHHLIDVVDPSTKYSVSDFKAHAETAIAAIHARGNVPILVGGTGLYVDAVLYDFTFRPAPHPEERLRLQQLSVSELQALVRDRNLPMPINAQNPRHLIRVIETNGMAPERSALRPNTLVLGLSIDRDVLRRKLESRVESMVADGLVAEVRHLAQKYGWEAPGLQAPAYKAFRSYIEGTASLDEAKLKFVQNDWQLAKRQRTWFKRNNDIKWICKSEEAVDLVTTFLNK